MRFANKYYSIIFCGLFMLYVSSYFTLRVSGMSFDVGPGAGHGCVYFDFDHDLANRMASQIYLPLIRAEYYWDVNVEHVVFFE